ncbi:hypothetical protein B0H16DRAFT_1732298 [Mycena metata]|uniref:F-box domain-containing protein n=1 Tax=Mycena metata TaxID=1033252 RepID=A0AAD7I295_9AGAR|nr:hypothetical protein B0H16DRAFT_1732298 [Mycena metata]
MTSTAVTRTSGRLFPPEIFSIILPDTFGSHITDFAAYTSNRRSVCLACRFWCQVVYTTPAAWNHIPVSLYTGARYLDFCLEKSKQLTIFLYFNLIPLAALEPSGLHPRPTPAEVVGDMFPLLSFGPSKVEEIFVRSTDASSYSAITLHLGQVDSTHLRRASLLVEGGRYEIAGQTLLPPPFSTSASTHVLKELRLGYSIPTSPMAAIYGNLSVLALCSYRSTAWEDVRRILRATPRLLVLHLTRVECRHSVFLDEGGNPVLPMLTDLFIAYTHPSGAELMSHIEMPMLVNLHLNIIREHRSSPPSLQALVRSCHHHLRSVTRLTVGVLIGTLAEVELFFGCLSQLRRLDLSNTSKMLTEDVIFLLLAKAFSFEKLAVVCFGVPLAYDKLAGLLDVLPEGCTLISPNPVVDCTFKYH